MKTLFLLLFMLVGLCSFSQDFILDKRSKIKNKMGKFYAENNRKYIFTETGSSVSYILNDSLSLPVTTIFYFNEQNRCIRQDNIYSCDSCLQQAKQHFLNNKYANWSRTEPGKYYAGFPYNTLMEQVDEDGKFILRLTRIKLKDIKITHVE